MVKCYCTGSGDCPDDQQKDCESDVSHCLLSLKRINESDSFVNSLQDCWQWHDVHCPSQPNVCYLLPESNPQYEHCCCKGDLCNTVENIVLKHPPINNYTDIDSELTINDPKVNLTPVINSTDSTNLDNNNLALMIALPITALLLLLACIVGHRILRFRLRSIRNKQNTRFSKSCKYVCERHSMKPEQLLMLHVNELPCCTCAQGSQMNNITVGECLLDHTQPGSAVARRKPTIGSGWLTETEIEGLGQKITKLEPKSHGCFGKVWRGCFRQPSHANSLGFGDLDMTRSNVAIKIFAPTHRSSWETEISVFRSLGSHTNILKYYGADIVENDAPSNVEYWLVTEYHPFGSLHDYLMTHTIDWFELLRMASGISDGLSFLHSEVTISIFSDQITASSAVIRFPFSYLKPCIAHRDINSRNVLLKSDLTACIADFGLAIQFHAGTFSTASHPQLGTRRYMAPEVLDGAIQFTRDAYLRIDVYAMGLVFWELLSRCTGDQATNPIQVTGDYKAPFEVELGPAPTMEQLQNWVARKKQRPHFDPAWSVQPIQTLCETVEECWDQDAEARLSAGCVSLRLNNFARQILCTDTPKENASRIFVKSVDFPSRLSLNYTPNQKVGNELCEDIPLSVTGDVISATHSEHQ